MGDLVGVGEDDTLRVTEIVRVGVADMLVLFEGEMDGVMEIVGEGDGEWLMGTQLNNTSTGNSLYPPVAELPSRPPPLLPQHCTERLVSSAHAWLNPTDTFRALLMPSTGTGTVLAAVALL